ncbi:MAG: Co2+/Mg2+ efflux protein ApaG [Planctomycetota bacterium]
MSSGGSSISLIDPGPHGSDTPTAVESGVVRVRVRPEYRPERSDAAIPRHYFGYQISITYDAPVGAPVVTLLSRRWTVIDAHGGAEHVEGEGVVGQQPSLLPGEQFEYSSHCPIRTRWGTMEGAYTFAAEDGSTFEVAIGRFYLVSEDA